MEKVIAGVYDTPEEAIASIQRLIDGGHDPKNISVLAKDERELDRVAEITHAKEKHVHDEINSAAYGAIAGFLAGIGGGVAVPGLGVPGFGPLLAAGPFALWFDEHDGDLQEVLEKLPLSKEQAERYVQDIDNGKILVMTEK